MLFRTASIAIVASASSFSGAALAQQQMADPEYKPVLKAPAYSKDGPMVLVDEAHNNFHTASGRYKPFAELLIADGYQVAPNTAKIDKDHKALEGARVLVIANPLGAAKMSDPQATDPAFTPEECDAIAAWVRDGGSLLLIADHAPMGAATESLAARLGVAMSKGFTFDLNNCDPESGNPTALLFTKENKLLADHAVTRGRNDGENVKRVVSFTGQSLKGPEGCVVFLALSPTAHSVANQKDLSTAIKQEQAKDQPSPADSWTAQGLLFSLGKGRVVVMGEAAMFTAQVLKTPGAEPGDASRKFGMNLATNEDQQLALNVMHWLTGALEH